ncbi:hypothetical protein GOC14_06925 [Sinorhizobium meliloti]|nr:hypothetical protein [Sinorhizobium meliloti]
MEWLPVIRELSQTLSLIVIVIALIYVNRTIRLILDHLKWRDRHGHDA